jgi:hypothetical protein
MPAPRPACPLSRSQFLAAAEPLSVTVAGTALVAVPKEFSTGSLGWYAGGKVTVQVGGVPVTVQVGLNLTAVGSRDLPR